MGGVGPIYSIVALNPPVWRRLWGGRIRFDDVEVITTTPNGTTLIKAIFKLYLRRAWRRKGTVWKQTPHLRGRLKPQ
jgi:hypothetical protein